MSTAAVPVLGLVFCETIRTEYSAVRFSRITLFWYTLSLFVVVGTCRADTLVASFNSATSEYLKRRPLEGPQETYVFMPGHFFEGNVRDRGLEKTKFIEIAQAVSVGLRKSRFQPAHEIESADLLLIVHWGVTIGTDRDREQRQREIEETTEHMAEYHRALQNEASFATTAQTENTSNYALGYNPETSTSSRAAKTTIDFDFVNRSSLQIERDTNGQSTAALLGFSPDLIKDDRAPMISAKASTLMSLLEANRYFVVVIAYDFQRFRTEKKLVRLWTSRLSIRSAGINFQTALRRISQAGAMSFGTSNPELAFVRTKKQKETVTPGEIVFVGFEAEPSNKSK